MYVQTPQSRNSTTVEAPRSAPRPSYRDTWAAILFIATVAGLFTIAGLSWTAMIGAWRSEENSCSSQNAFTRRTNVLSEQNMYRARWREDCRWRNDMKSLMLVGAVSPAVAYILSMLYLASLRVYYFITFVQRMF